MVKAEFSESIKKPVKTGKKLDQANVNTFKKRKLTH